MKDNASNYIELAYYSRCLGDGPLVKTDKCGGIKVGSKVEFTVEVKVPRCPEKRSDWNQTFAIKPVRNLNTWKHVLYSSTNQSEF